MSENDKIRGCLIGGAAGDALGAPVEFMCENEIFDRFGENGITDYVLDRHSVKALITDDTQMSLFTAVGLLIGDTRLALRGIQGYPRHYVEYTYLDWLYTQEHSYHENANANRKSWLCDIPELYHRRAPGNTCISALKNLKNSERFIEDFTEYKQNNSKGCGGVMRVAPLAVNYREKPSSEDEEYFKICHKELDMEGAQLAAITHSHSLGYIPAAILTHIVHFVAFHNMTVSKAVSDAMDSACKIYKNDEHISEMKDIIDLAVELSTNSDSDLDNIHKLGQGWVAEEALAIAVYCSLKYQNDFSKGIIAAVNHNGDSDSTGAITGNILGALLGYDAIDNKWKENLELHDVIIEIADDMTTGCQMDEFDSYRDENWLRKYVYMKR